MAPYPKELRVRVVAAVEEGRFAIPEIARLFQVGVTFIKKMLRLHRTGAPLDPRHGGGPTPALQEPETARLRQALQAHPDATLAELPQVLADSCQTRVSLATISRRLQVLHLPRKKKSLLASERDDKARKQFRKLTSAFASNTYVFIDEMGTNLGFTRRYGRAAPGTRVLEQGPGDRGGKVSTIGAIARDGIRTGLSVPGAIAGETLLFFVEELLAPTLKRGELVVLDNNPTHQLDEIAEAIAAGGAGVLLLPTYSPDLNPIENCWSKVKAGLRSLKPRTLPDLLDALVTAFASVTEHDIRGWFEHCGYRVALT
jgi:transposase